MKLELCNVKFYDFGSIIFLKLLICGYCSEKAVLKYCMDIEKGFDFLQRWLASFLNTEEDLAVERLEPRKICEYVGTNDQLSQVQMADSNYKKQAGKAQELWKNSRLLR